MESVLTQRHVALHADAEDNYWVATREDWFDSIRLPLLREMRRQQTTG